MAMETREAPPAHLLIKIESFSLVSKCEVYEYETKEFVAGNYKWKLIIYPNGHQTEKHGDYLSVFLAITNTNSLHENWEVNALFSIFIFNQTSGNYLYTAEKKTRRFFTMKTKWGFPTFISKKVLTDPSSGYLVDDNCVFGAEVFVIENKAVTECLSLKNVTYTYKQVLEISNFSKLEVKWTSEEFTAGGRKCNSAEESQCNSCNQVCEDTTMISLYPNGHGDGIGFGLSIFLHYVGSDNKKCGERVKACFTICMKNYFATDKNLKKTDSYWFSASNNTWEWSKFLSLASFNDPKGYFLVEDCCCLEVEISVQAVAR